MSSSTISRKEDHVRLCTERDVRFRHKTTGFERFDFDYVALPEVNLDEIDTHAEFLGKRLRLPLLVSSMTGGYAGATSINAALAAFCQRHRLALGVGSMRQALESDAYIDSFRIVRETAPDVPIIANIGATQLVQGVGLADIERLIKLIGADAVAVHLNPLQELLQPEGTPKFRGVRAALSTLAQHCSVPVIVKEVGAGISGRVAQVLLDAGISIIDVAGAGGTSWAGVELMRSSDQLEEHPLAELWDCGIPTADCIVEVNNLRQHYQFTLIASGGITSGFDAVKALILGADLVGIARPLLQAYQRGGDAELDRYLWCWELQLRAAMFVTGCNCLAALRNVSLRPRVVNDSSNTQ
jgi:isopentenyl-diphosphate delta-isomerase